MKSREMSKATQTQVKHTGSNCGEFDRRAACGVHSQAHVFQAHDRYARSEGPRSEYLVLRHHVGFVICWSLGLNLL